MQMRSALNPLAMLVAVQNCVARIYQFYALKEEKEKRERKELRCMTLPSNALNWNNVDIILATKTDTATATHNEGLVVREHDEEFD